VNLLQRGELGGFVNRDTERRIDAISGIENFRTMTSICRGTNNWNPNYKRKEFDKPAL